MVQQQQQQQQPEESVDLFEGIQYRPALCGTLVRVLVDSRNAPTTAMSRKQCAELLGCE
jgi:hypothetical protein